MLFNKHTLALSTLTISSLALLSSGCSGNKDAEGRAAATPYHITAADGQVAAKLASDGRSAESAAEYARIGELLLLPEGVGYADKMFDKALELDASNGKANFYSAITKPLMKMQGFITRFQLVAEPEDAKKLQQLRKEIEKLNLPELTNFAVKLPAGKAPFATYHEVQRFMREELLPEVLNSVNKIAKLSSKPELELNINLARLGFPKTQSEYSYDSNCNKYSYTYNDYKKDSNGNYVRDPYTGRYVMIEVRQDTWNCYYSSYYRVEAKDLMKAERILVDASDLKIAKGSLMALADSLRLNSAYSFEGLQEALKNLELLDEKRRDSGRTLTTKDVIQELARHPELFTIERDHELVAMARSQEQVLRHALDLGELQSELCGNSDRLTGENLIKSLCIHAKDLKNVRLALDLLAGPKAIKIGYDSEHDEVYATFNLVAFINNPPADVKTIFPTRFDRKGKPIHWPDPTFGGLVPEGDLVEKLEHVVVGTPLPREGFKFKWPRFNH